MKTYQRRSAYGQYKPGDEHLAGDEYTRTGAALYDAIARSTLSPVEQARISAFAGEYATMSYRLGRTIALANVQKRQKQEAEKD